MKSIRVSDELQYLGIKIMNASVNPTQYCVIEDYRRTNADPITLQKGDPVCVGREYDGDPEWQGWIWCVCQNNKGGWVPRSLLTIRGSSGTARAAYSARELSLPKGEILGVIEIVNGWARARRSNGETGWVPLRNLEPQKPSEPDPHHGDHLPCL